MADGVAVAQGIAGLVLFVAGVSKISDLSTFASQVKTYAVLPRALAAPVGYTLPPLEIVTGLGVLAVPALGAPLAALVYSSFALAVGINLARGRTELRCGCFGPRGSHRISLLHVLMNLCLVALSVVATLSTEGLVPLAALMTAASILAAVAALATTGRLLADARDARSGTIGVG